MSEVRITNLPPNKYMELSNIADYYGISVPNFLRVEMGKLIEAYPEHIRNFKKIDLVKRTAKAKQEP